MIFYFNRGERGFWEISHQRSTKECCGSRAGLLNNDGESREPLRLRNSRDSEFPPTGCNQSGNSGQLYESVAGLFKMGDLKVLMG